MEFTQPKKESMRERFKSLLRLLIPAPLRPSLKKAWYGGRRYVCPFCRSRLRTLLPIGLELPVLELKNVAGSGYRRAVCPVCISHDRERLIYLYLLHKTDVFQSSLKLLHVAPERKLSAMLGAQTSLDYLTGDLKPERAMVKMDVADLRLDSASFDAVICNHVLEHVADDRKAMSELFRILRPGGWAILQVPISLTMKNTYEDFSLATPDARRRAFGQGNHVRLYGQDYAQRLEETGFDVELFDWTREADKFGGPKNRFGLDPRERVYVARKPRQPA